MYITSIITQKGIAMNCEVNIGNYFRYGNSNCFIDSRYLSVCHTLLHNYSN